MRPLTQTKSRLQMTWFVGVSAMAFVIPLVFSSWLELHDDVYYLVYFTFVAAVVGAYVRVSEINATPERFRLPYLAYRHRSETST